MFETDINSGARTFSYVVSAVPFGTEASGFPFVDSQGNRMNCNFAEITVHYDGNQSQSHCLFWVEPSSLGFTHAGNSMKDYSVLRTQYTMEAIGAGNVSGNCGSAGYSDSGHPGHVHLKCTNNALMDSVMMRFEDEPKGGSAGVISVELTYGNITPFNTLRQDRFDKGI